MKKLSSKERVLATFANQEPDRVPIDARLKAHFGLSAGDREGLLDALGVDFRGVGAPFRGPKRHEDIPERGPGEL